MKTALFLILILGSSMTLSAQSLPSIKSNDALNAGTEALSQGRELSDEQIKEALMKDEELQTATIDHLKSNPDTKSSMAKLAMKSMAGGSGGLMKSLLGDQNLAAAAISFVQSNPDMLSKALKIIGM